MRVASASSLVLCVSSLVISFAASAPNLAWASGGSGQESNANDENQAQLQSQRLSSLFDEQPALEALVFQQDRGPIDVAYSAGIILKLKDNKVTLQLSDISLKLAFDLAAISDSNDLRTKIRWDVIWVELRDEELKNKVDLTVGDGPVLLDTNQALVSSNGESLRTVIQQLSHTARILILIKHAELEVSKLTVRLGNKPLRLSLQALAEQLDIRVMADRGITWIGPAPSNRRMKPKAKDRAI